MLVYVVVRASVLHCRPGPSLIFLSVNSSVYLCCAPTAVQLTFIVGKFRSLVFPSFGGANSSKSKAASEAAVTAFAPLSKMAASQAAPHQDSRISICSPLGCLTKDLLLELLHSDDLAVETVGAVGYVLAHLNRTTSAQRPAVFMHYTLSYPKNCNVIMFSSS